MRHPDAPPPLASRAAGPDGHGTLPLVMAAGLAASRRFGVRAPVDPRLARRRWAVGIAKWLLPVAALALLSTVALWPELAGDTDHALMTYRRGSIEPQSGQLSDATYHGVDDRGHPYTMTATTAHQVTPERINLTDPKGDLTLDSGSWLLVQSRLGVYLQHVGSLDLWNEVHLYRDDGTTMDTSSATVDLKAGAAAGAEMTHAEGPFGSLDAQGFTVVDKGAVIQFAGPGRLVLNSAHAAAPAQGASAAGVEPAPPVLAPTMLAPPVLAPPVLAPPMLAPASGVPRPAAHP
jgi:lipopolysaccharide export system protein LptC